jgi:RNA-dependent RNA polymerase
MEGIPFATRSLIEGLIAHAILQPGQVVALWDALQTYAAVPAFKNRILESIYQEERIRDPHALVRGDYTIK